MRLTILFAVFTFFIILLFIYVFNIEESNSYKAVDDQKFVPAVIKETFEKEYVPEELAISKIFSRDHEWIATLSAERVRTVVATGDIMLGRSVNYKINQEQDSRWPFLYTARILKNSDITYTNLENPLVKDCPLTNEGFKFCGSLENVEGLAFAGIDIVSLANNHSGNYGNDGINQTIDVLSKANISVVGLNNPAYKDIDGFKFAFLAYNDIYPRIDGVAWADKDRIREEIASAAVNADVVIIMFHWGEEYTHLPTKSQRDIARLSIDSGADLVLGNHPHWYQPLEKYKNKYIVYSHGNFVFDQMWSEKTREGIVGKYVFYDDVLIDIELIPIYMNDIGQPKLAEENRRAKILNELKNQSIFGD